MGCQTSLAFVSHLNRTLSSFLSNIRSSVIMALLGLSFLMQFVVVALDLKTHSARSFGLAAYRCCGTETVAELLLV
jgi:hypothetical protein